MAKKRKTRSQKIAADLKRQDLSIRASASPSFSLPVTSLIKPTASVRTITHTTVNEYQFVRHDLIKTSLITGAVIVVELVLSFLMR